MNFDSLMNRLNNEKEETRIQKMARLMYFNQALENKDFIGMIHHSGLSEELAETMTMSDILDSISVRMLQIAQEVGLRQGADSDE